MLSADKENAPAKILMFWTQKILRTASPVSSPRYDL